MTTKKEERRFAKIKKELEMKKQDLDEELSRLSQEKFSNDTVQDQGDQALTSTMESLSSSMQQSKLEEYKRIESALQKIEDGVYGICIDCDEPISEKRLQHFLNAERCLTCQEEYEANAEEEA